MVFIITILFITASASPFAVVLKQLMTQFKVGRGEVSLSQSITNLATGFTGIFVGRSLYRHNPKKFILFGTVLTGITSFLLSASNTLWVFYVFSLLAGISGSFCNAIAIFSLLSKWFVRKWGLAIGIVLAGGGVGSIIIQPLVGIIDQNFSWRATYLFAGLLVLSINVPLILFILKDSPESMGLIPDDDKSRQVVNVLNSRKIAQSLSRSTQSAAKIQTFSYLKSSRLWLMGISFALVSIGYSAVTSQEVSLITDMRVSATIAASARGITLGIGAVSALASGWLADRLISRYVVILFFLLTVGGMLVLLQAGTMSKIWLFVAIYGFGTGAFGTLLPIVTKDIFGVRDFTSIFGFALVLLFAGNAIGAPLAGFMYDATGSYRSVFMIITAINVIAIIGIYFAYGIDPKPLLRLPASKNGNVQT